MADRDVRAVPPLQGDEDTLFRRYDERIHSLTQSRVRTSEDNVADACAFAWQQFLVHQPNRESAFAWLATTARREAWRLDGQQRRLELTQFEDVAEHPIDVADSLTRRETMRDAAERMQPLSNRDRSVLLLQAVGWTLEETAQRLGVSPGRVGQLVSRSREVMRQQGGREMPESESPRARLLAELQRKPPPFLRAIIGRPPRSMTTTGGQRRLDWSRIAMKVVDHRLTHGITDPARAFGRDDEHPRPAPELTREIDSYDERYRPRRPGASRGVDR